MRKTILFSILVFSALFAKGQVYDTIRICDRMPNYYYGDEWVDHYSRQCYGNCDLRHCVWQKHNGIAILAKLYNIDTSLNVIGIAAPININYSEPIADTSRVPEFFYLYDITDTGCTLAGEVRWDTATVRHQMEFVFGTTDVSTGPSQYLYHWDSIAQPDTARIYFPVYEAYFYKPITVYDSFYVAGSTFNNEYIAQGLDGYSEHPLTEYIRWINNLNQYGSCNGGSNTYLGHAHLDPYMSPNSHGEIDPTDGSSFGHFHAQWGGFGCIFPIFDTTPPGANPHHDTCYSTTGLHIMDINDEVVILGWNPANNNKWEIAIVKGDTATANPDDGVHNTYTESFALFYYLDSAWYTAYIRTVCDGDLRSEWSEPVHFHFPPADTTNTGILWQSPADRFTNVVPNPASSSVTVFSSFRLNAVDIFSLDGRKIAHQTANGISSQMDISALPPATYIVHIKTKGGNATKKLVKK